MSQMVEHQPAEARGLTKNEVFGIAEEVAKTLSYRPGHEIEPIVAKLGGKIHYLDYLAWKNTESGSILVNGPKDFDIFVSRFTSPLRDRFTIAHELGHYFLHSDQGQKQIHAARNGSNPVEWEANWFAAAFLMPAKDFNEAWSQSSGDLESVAAKFLVSTKAVDVRRRSLTT